MTAPAVGIVAIGRNEGERLRRCLLSALRETPCVVYVDSGSSDGSVALARRLGAVVVELDLAVPFTAARARNAGFRALRARWPGLSLVQFVDGDCQLFPTWLDRARRFLADRPDVVAVCGRRRECAPERSIYNRLCDLEWDTPVGEAGACGGDVLLRSDALAAVGGYREGLIAGEEPELCVRLRRAGGRVWRLDADMTLHDAAMYRFGQWWRRTLRSGHAFAEGAALHGEPPWRHWVAERRRAVLWGLALPVAAAAAVPVWPPASVVLLLAYPLQVLRLGLRSAVRPRRARWLRALFLVLGRFPEAAGVIHYYGGRLRGHGSTLIEYK